VLKQYKKGNMTKNAVILMGLPLSGKTTWINEQPELREYITVSADILKENHPDYDPEKAY